MASYRVGETGLSNSVPSNHHLPYALVHGIDTPSANFINQEGSAFDFGELEEAIVLQGVQIRNDEAKAPLFTVAARRAATLEMFPSRPIRSQQTPGVVVSWHPFFIFDRLFCLLMPGLDRNNRP